MRWQRFGRNFAVPELKSTDVDDPFLQSLPAEPRMTATAAERDSFDGAL